MHHAGAAGGQHQIHGGHNQIGHFQGGRVDPGDDAFGSAGFHRSLQHDAGGFGGGLLGPGMGADDDAVTGLQADQRLENGGGGGVGGGHHSADDTDGLGDLLDAEGGVFLQHAAGLFMLIGIINIFRSVVILDDLILYNAHAGFFHSQLRQVDASLVGSGCSGQENLIHLLLVKSGELCLGSAATGDGLSQLIGIGDGGDVLQKNRSFSILCYRFLCIDIISSKYSIVKYLFMCI